MSKLTKQPIEKPQDITYFKLNNMVNIHTESNEIQLNKDREAVRAYFLEKINPNTVFFHTLEEKINYLIEHDYIEEGFIKKYELSFIKDLFKFLYDQKFRFNSFMGAYKFYNQYALKTNDGSKILERYEDRIGFASLYLADGNEKLAWNIAKEHITQRLQLATPTFLNAGKTARGELVSCFLVDIQDNMEAIGRSINSALQLSKRGGGVGINLSNLREAGAPIKKIANAGSGVVPVMKIFEDSFSYANQLGQRNGAGAVYLNVFHPDIYEFLSTKKENADEKIRVKTLSLGLVVPDKYYELLKTNAPMYLFSPYDVEKIYGQPFTYINITEKYDEMVQNDQIKKYKINARELEQEISKLQQESGYPYIINVDTANKDNPIYGQIIMSNLCSEILQVQSPSELNEDLSYKKVGHDISCNLGSTNITEMIKTTNFEESIETAVRALTSVSDMTSIKAVPTVEKGNKSYNSIGLGAMGLHTALATNQIHYGSADAIEFTDAYFRTVRFYALKASNKIARERETSFYEFEKSTYADGSYLTEKYINQAEFSFESEKVAEIFKGIPIPTTENWKELNASIIEHGLYNAYLLAIAPTGSISYINEASSSLHPIVNLIENRQEENIGSIYYPAPHLNNETINYYKSAYDTDMRDVINTYVAAQQHIDQGMSLTLFMRSVIPEGLYEWKNGKSPNMTTRDLNRLRNYAWSKGIKSIYYVRTHTGNYAKEIGVNECESCLI
ncbi:class 1b ribonucleoside-diphosphate reductase subunit alpha [Amphibacillus indicireducens]|uniref:Ribonucleoside-diphosphate reductase n=1 Tax=Amphibacillus indicireducens TaxID=1076330 RepID=A0ABP7VCV0_9BACI